MTYGRASFGSSRSKRVLCPVGTHKRNGVCVKNKGVSKRDKAAYNRALKAVTQTIKPTAQAKLTAEFRHEQKRERAADAGSWLKANPLRGGHSTTMSAVVPPPRVTHIPMPFGIPKYRKGPHGQIVRPLV